MNEVRVFTLEEANQLLPILNQLLVELQKKRNQVTDFEAQIDAMELISDSKSKKSVQELNRLVAKHQEQVAGFYSIVEEIQKHGCLLKDVDAGLIDFYGLIDGRMVFWCWKLGEEKVSFWHEINSSYSGRVPIEEELT